MIDFLRPLIRIAIVSDLHAYSSVKNSNNSLLDFSGSTLGAPNPLADLSAEIEEQKVTADILVCAGDICNQADYGGLERAWQELHSLRAKLGDAQLVATCGNHDLDSRFLLNESDPDPKGALLSLMPPFPFGDNELTNKFWAKNYAVLTHPSGTVIAALNTSAYHGGKQDEILHGRVSKRTIAALAAELKSHKDAPAHVLVCHHHPIPLSGAASVDDGEYIRNGQDLLDEIVSATGQSCLIIHGHRHKPRMLQGTSSRNAAPYILGAGSIGARISGVPNQFHIVNLYQSGENDHASVVGTVETWSWTDSSKWSRLGHAGLPPFCGFGYQGQTKILAAKIAAIANPCFAKWDNVRSQIPSVELLMPDAWNQLEDELAKLGLTVLRDKNSRPVQVGS